jgi:hypothetical protein
VAAHRSTSISVIVRPRTAVHRGTGAARSRSLRALDTCHGQMLSAPAHMRVSRHGLTNAPSTIPPTHQKTALRATRGRGAMNMIYTIASHDLHRLGHHGSDLQCRLRLTSMIRCPRGQIIDLSRDNPRFKVRLAASCYYDSHYVYVSLQIANASYCRKT